MKNGWIGNPLAALLVLLVAPAILLAASPVGEFELSLDDQAAIWDLSGNYSEQTANLATNFTLLQDDDGKIVGQGNATSDNGSLTTDLNFDVLGSVKTAAGTTRAVLKTNYRGTATNGFRTFRARGRITLNLEIDKATKMLLGTARGSVCVVRVGCTRINDPVNYAMPPAGDGTWTLALDIGNTTPANLVGTGTATFHNGRQEGFLLSGKYNDRRDSAVLRLKGNAGIITLQAQVIGDILAIQRMSARVLGQQARIP